MEVLESEPCEGYDRAFSGAARGERPRARPAQGGFMAKWVRVAYQGREYIGKLEGDTVRVHSGNMFAGPEATSQAFPLSAAKLLTPSVPGKIIALIDNYHELLTKLEHAVPAEPLYLLKGNNSFLGHGETIRAPKSYGGKVVYEGELGIVIGKRTSGMPDGDAARHIFGYTCINDNGRARRVSTPSGCSVPVSRPRSIPASSSLRPSSTARSARTIRFRTSSFPRRSW
jgi:2-keto-4-pentenoate hydratase/2-oxohepta-3-ene-1,7-dioic acid hydratase in catechol pathway